MSEDIPFSNSSKTIDEKLEKYPSGIVEGL